MSPDRAKWSSGGGGSLISSKISFMLRLGRLKNGRLKLSSSSGMEDMDNAVEDGFSARLSKKVVDDLERMPLGRCRCLVAAG